MGAPGVGGVGSSLSFGRITVSTRDEVCNLGVLLDPALSMENQVTSVVQSAYFHLRWIVQLCPYLNTQSLNTQVHALVVSRIDHCNTLYVGLFLRLTQMFQQVQNVVARLVGESVNINISP